MCIKDDTFSDLIFLARYPNTKSMASITLDLPLPLGPTIDVKHWRGERRRGREKEKGEEKESEGGEIERGREVKQEKKHKKDSQYLQ